MKTKAIPFSFVLEELYSCAPRTRSMFGCTAVYVGEKIVLVLRERVDHPDDNGVWVATSREHHESLRQDLPSIQSLGLFGTDSTGWQNIPSAKETFENEVIRACELILKNDPRIGKIPKARARAKKKAATKKASPRNKR